MASCRRSTTRTRSWSTGCSRIILAGDQVAEGSTSPTRAGVPLRRREYLEDWTGCRCAERHRCWLRGVPAPADARPRAVLRPRDRRARRPLKEPLLYSSRHGARHGAGPSRDVGARLCSPGGRRRRARGGATTTSDLRPPAFGDLRRQASLFAESRGGRRVRRRRQVWRRRRSGTPAPRRSRNDREQQEPLAPSQGRWRSIVMKVYAIQMIPCQKPMKRMATYTDFECCPGSLHVHRTSRQAYEKRRAARSSSGSSPSSAGPVGSSRYSRRGGGDLVVDRRAQHRPSVPCRPVRFPSATYHGRMRAHAESANR